MAAPAPPSRMDNIKNGLVDTSAAGDQTTFKTDIVDRLTPIFESAVPGCQVQPGSVKFLTKGKPGEFVDGLQFQVKHPDSDKIFYVTVTDLSMLETIAGIKTAPEDLKKLDTWGTTLVKVIGVGVRLNDPDFNGGYEVKSSGEIVVHYKGKEIDLETGRVKELKPSEDKENTDKLMSLKEKKQRLKVGNLFSTEAGRNKELAIVQKQIDEIEKQKDEPGSQAMAQAVELLTQALKPIKQERQIPDWAKAIADCPDLTQHSLVEKNGKLTLIDNATLAGTGVATGGAAPGTTNAPKITYEDILSKYPDIKNNLPLQLQLGQLSNLADDDKLKLEAITIDPKDPDLAKKFHMLVGKEGFILKLNGAGKLILYHEDKVPAGIADLEATSIDSLKALLKNDSIGLAVLAKISGQDLTPQLQQAQLRTLLTDASFNQLDKMDVRKVGDKFVLVEKRPQIDWIVVEDGGHLKLDLRSSGKAPFDGDVYLVHTSTGIQIKKEVEYNALTLPVKLLAYDHVDAVNKNGVLTFVEKEVIDMGRTKIVEQNGKLVVVDNFDPREHVATFKAIQDSSGYRLLTQAEFAAIDPPPVELDWRTVSLKYSNDHYEIVPKIVPKVKVDDLRDLFPVVPLEVELRLQKLSSAPPTDAKFFDLDNDEKVKGQAAQLADLSPQTAANYRFLMVKDRDPSNAFQLRLVSKDTFNTYWKNKSGNDFKDLDDTQRAHLLKLADLCAADPKAMANLKAMIGPERLKTDVFSDIDLRVDQTDAMVAIFKNLASDDPKMGRLHLSKGNLMELTRGPMRDPSSSDVNAFVTQYQKWVSTELSAGRLTPKQHIQVQKNMEKVLSQVGADGKALYTKADLALSDAERTDMNAFFGGKGISDLLFNHAALTWDPSETFQLEGKNIANLTAADLGANPKEQVINAHKLKNSINTRYEQLVTATNLQISTAKTAMPNAKKAFDAKEAERADVQKNLTGARDREYLLRGLMRDLDKQLRDNPPNEAFLRARLAAHTNEIDRLNGDEHQEGSIANLDSKLRTIQGQLSPLRETKERHERTLREGPLQLAKFSRKHNEALAKADAIVEDLKTPMTEGMQKQVIGLILHRGPAVFGDKAQGNDNSLRWIPGIVNAGTLKVKIGSIDASFQMGPDERKAFMVTLYTEAKKALDDPMMPLIEKRQVLKNLQRALEGSIKGKKEANDLLDVVNGAIKQIEGGETVEFEKPDSLK